MTDHDRLEALSLWVKLKLSWDVTEMTEEDIDICDPALARERLGLDPDEREPLYHVCDQVMDTLEGYLTLTEMCAYLNGAQAAAEQLA